MNRKQLYSGAAVLLLLVTACTITGPEAGPVPGPEGKAAVSVSIAAAGIQGRTILPGAVLTDVTAWELWGGPSGDTETLLEDFSTAGATVYLEAGLWDFTLKGYKSTDLILEGAVTGQNITLEGPNVLTITVSPLLAGSGTFKITITLPEGHGITEAKVFQDGTQIDTVTPDGDLIVFEDEYVAGDYYFSFQLCGNSGFYGVVSEMVQVRAYLRSEKTHTLGREDLNLVYVINYYPQGGLLDGGVDNPAYYRSTDAAIILPVPGRTGYAFGGWYETAGLSGSPVTGIPQGGTADRDFYAKWTAISYTVDYDANGGDGGTTETSAHTYDQAKALTANGFTRTGYTFAGWNTALDGTGTAYADGEAVENLTAVDGAAIIFYAQWTGITYYVAYDKNAADAAGSTGTSAHTYGTAGNLTGNGFSRTGYTFAGWAVSAEGNVMYTDGQSVAYLSPVNGAVVNLYARWRLNEYLVAYNANGGTGTTAGSYHTYGQAQTLTINGFTRTGYIFAGWNTESGGTGTSYGDEGSVINLTTANGVTVTLYAQWTAITYTVDYDANGGDGGTTVASSHTYDQARNLTANGFTRTGYTFTGWNTQPDGGGTGYADGQSVTSLTFINGDIVTLYAQWAINTYTVAYNANGGTGTTESSAHTYDQAKTLTVNGFTRTDYTFAGWNTASNGSGASYTDGQSVTNLTIENGVTVTLYALWLPDVFVNVSVWVNEDGDILASNDNVTISKSASHGNENSFTAEVTGAYSGVQWYLNGGPVYGSRGTARSITVNAADYAGGNYYLGVTVTRDGVPYSTDIYFTVVN